MTQVSNPIIARDINEIMAIFKGIANGDNHEFIGYPATVTDTLDMMRHIKQYITVSGAKRAEMMLRTATGKSELVMLYAE